MDAMLFLIAAAVAGSLTFALLATFRAASATGEAVRSRLVPADDRPASAASSGLKPLTGGVLSIGRKLPLGIAARERMQQDLDRAGMHWRASEYLALRMGIAIAFSVIALLVAFAFGLPPVAAALLPLPFVVLGWLIPRWYIRRKRTRRLIAVEKQLPDALTAVAKSLRAGSGLLQGLAYAADETPAPLGPELASTLRDLQLGADPEQAFEALSERMGSKDLEIAVTAINIQRSVGGNLSETLSNVTATIRERVKIQNEVRVLTARQRLTANFMAVIPVAVAAAFIALSPDVGSQLLTTTPGLIALGVGLLLEFIGIVVIRRMAVIEV